MGTGIGTDIHKLEAGVSMWVVGLYFPDEPLGLSGHSGGDVTTRVIVDTLLASAGPGNIRLNFSMDRPEWRGAPGIAFLIETARLPRAAGFGIYNASAQVIGNRPRAAACRGEAERVLPEVIRASVSVSTTTTDGLGLTGRGEGVATIAVAMTTAG